ncbi:MAG TPA: dTDP-4-dehydrorhamnose 3,5-epimerase [Candidatus Limiplasma sp.]|nr:dTDP-4-dehydrorhamnose 3,5-epimerase [Candidatus Limiplasma sp.]HRX09236.1 dTDP-4-dehydrorhamnose 3,5-epimerase [Candidatus Limiplasma sp.]
MSKFTFQKTAIEGLYEVEPTVFGDARGYFMETYNPEFSAIVRHLDGSPAFFVQDNESHSMRGVLRGLHYQKKNPQGKLVRVIHGEVYDVAVDIRPGSPTYGSWHGVLLSQANRRQFYVPEGCAHGYLTLSETATFLYKCTRLYDPADEAGIRWDDPDIGIAWPVDGLDILLSDKDQRYPCLREIRQ